MQRTKKVIKRESFLTYNFDTKLLCSRDHRTHLSLSIGAAKNSPLTESSPWKKHPHGKVVHNHSILRSTNVSHLQEDLNITILSIHVMHYPYNCTCYAATVSYCSKL